MASRKIESPALHGEAASPPESAAAGDTPAEAAASSLGGVPNVSCDHCGLPVPAGLIDPDAKLQFCCHGCKTVYEVIRGSGLDRFYALRDSAGEDGEPARTTSHTYEEFDDPAFANLYGRPREDGLQCVELYLEGVHCAACVWLVEKLPRVSPGVVEARLDMRRRLVRISWDASAIALSRVARTLDSLGYPPHPARDAKSRKLRQQEDRRFLVNIGVAFGCAGFVMSLSLALYGAMFSRDMAAGHGLLFRVASMIAGWVALVWPGSLFFRGALAAIRTRTANLDLPIAVALAVGGIAGTVNALLGLKEVYCDSLTVLVFLLLVGRWIQHRQQRWATDSVELMFSLAPRTARIVAKTDAEKEAVVKDHAPAVPEGGTSQEQVARIVPIEAVKPGDLIEVLADESLPVDGEVVQGTSAIDQSLLTGETKPVAVGVGDTVIAGAVNVRAPLRVRVLAAGAETRVGKLMRLVEEYSHRRAPVVQMVDRIAGWFAIVVISLAVLTFALWAMRDVSSAVQHAAALLIVTCPCALGLATPLTLAVSLGRAAKNRILVKGGDVFERLAGGGALYLDKTGTLTHGRVSLVQYFGDDALRPLIARLEQASSHPIALAISRGLGDDAADEDAGSPAAARNVEQVRGSGVRGVVDGRSIAVGSPVFVRSEANLEDAWVQLRLQEVLAAGLTPVMAAADGEITAVMGLGDPIREEAADAIEALRAMGYSASVLSGDHPDVVKAVATRLGIDPAEAHGGLLPEQKVRFLEGSDNGKHADVFAPRSHASSRSLPTVMVGDGVNDAAALAAADVGVAVHGGAEASMAAADVYLDRPGLRGVVDLVRAGRRTMGTVRRCLGLSLVYNVVAASLAMAGVINPLVAAILMPISSFSVLLMAVSARTFDDDV